MSIRNQEKKSKRSILRRVFLSLGITVGVFVFGVVIFVLLNLGDEEFKYEHLIQVEESIVPDEENAFYAFQALTGTRTAYDEEIDPLIDDTGFNDRKLYYSYIAGEIERVPDEFAKEFYERNKEALDALHDMVETYDRFQFPLHANLDRYVGLPSYSENPLPFTRLVTLDSLWLIEQGDIEKGYEQLFDLYKFGFLERNAEPFPTMTGHLIGLSISSTALQGINIGMHKATVPTTILDEIKTIMSTHSAFRQQGKNATLSQIYSSAQYPDSLYVQRLALPFQLRGILKRYFFKPNKMRNELIAPMAIQLEEIEACKLDPRREQLSQDWRGVRQGGYWDMLASFLGPGGGTNILTSLLTVFLGDQYEAVCELEFYAGATQVSAAIHQYMQDTNGVPPASLDELVPQYLNDIPRDPFTADQEQIGFDSTRGLLTSVGVDPEKLFSLGIDDLSTMADFD